MIKSIKEGEIIEFYTCCNADRKLFRGKVEYKDQLGFITIVDGNLYEVKQLVDIVIIDKVAQ